jgi:hypothetical protein
MENKVLGVIILLSRKCFCLSWLCFSMSIFSSSDEIYYVFTISLNKGQVVPIECGVLTRELLDSTKCYLLDCGSEIYAWMGRETTLEERKRSGSAAEVVCLASVFLVMIIWLHFS